MKKITLQDVVTEIKSLFEDEGVETLLGAMVTTHGTWILLFSPRFNKDHSLLISSQDVSMVLTRVRDALEVNTKEIFCDR